MEKKIFDLVRAGVFVSDLIVQCFPMAQDKDDSVDSLMKSEIRGKVCQASYDE